MMLNSVFHLVCQYLKLMRQCLFLKSINFNFHLLTVPSCFVVFHQCKARFLPLIFHVARH